MTGWTALLVAGLLEIVWLIAMKRSHGFTRLWPSLAFLVAASASFWLLAVALRTIPTGTAYAVWTGIGAMGGVVIGILLFGDPVTAIRMFCIALILAGVVGLKIWGGAPAGP